MEAQNKWIPFHELDFDDVLNDTFNIDTRDFHAGYFKRKEKAPKFDVVKRLQGSYILTKEEVIELINRYFTESGGEATWRMLSLESYSSWFKYIRIYRTKIGFYICDSYDIPLKRDILFSPVNKTHLHTH